MLSSCPNLKPHLVRSAGIQILTKHLSSDSIYIACNALWAIQGLSDQAANQKNMDDLLRALVALLASTSVIVNSVVCCIANLTYDSKLNKQLFFQFNGLEVLLKLLLKASNDECLVEPTLTAIRHMVREHPSFEECQRMVRNAGAIGTIVRYMSPAGDQATGLPALKWSTNRKAVQLVRNLARNPANSDKIREYDALKLLFDLLVMTNNESRNKGADFEKDGVKVQQFIADILHTFVVLAKNQADCQRLVHLDFVSLSIEMFAYQTDEVISLITVVLSTLANYSLGKHIFVLFFD